MQVQSVPEIEAYWDSFSDAYTTQDNGTNVFYLSLLNMLKIEKRNSILEVGAGAGFLYHHTMNRKRPESSYTATDLSEKMLQIMCKRLKIEGNPSEKIVNAQYNLTIEKANGEELHYADNTFDCYIANLCLQITTDPVKMLAESFRVLQKGGVAGFTVWGSRDNSYFFTLIPSLFSEYDYKPLAVRSMFHLNDREQLIKMMEDAGYSNVICWNQFSPFHHTTDEEILHILNFPNNAQFIDSAGDKKEEIKQRIINKLREHIQINKLPLGLDGLIIIGTKN